MGNLEKRYADDEIIAALTKTGGDVYAAAEILGCSHCTIYARKNSVPRIAEAIEAVRGRTRYGLIVIAFEQAIAKAEIGDTADLHKLINRLDIQLNDGNVKPLEHHHEHTGTDGGPIQIDITKLREEMLANDDYLDFQRQRATAVDTDPGPVCPDSERGPVEDGEASGLPRPSHNGHAHRNGQATAGDDATPSRQE